MFLRKRLPGFSPEFPIVHHRRLMVRHRTGQMKQEMRKREEEKVKEKEKVVQRKWLVSGAQSSTA